jgi:hypothetical protein
MSLWFVSYVDGNDDNGHHDVIDVHPLRWVRGRDVVLIFWREMTDADRYAFFVQSGEESK